MSPEATSSKRSPSSRLASLTSVFPPIIKNIRRSSDVAPPTPLSELVSRSRSSSGVPIRDGIKKQPPSRSPTLPTLSRASPAIPPSTKVKDGGERPACRANDSPRRASEPPTITRKVSIMRRRSETLSSLSDEPLKCLEARPFLGYRRPKIFEKYKPVKSIGKGQFGTVFEVVERRRDVASSGDKMTKRVSEMTSSEKPQSFACKIIDLISRGADADKNTKARLQSRINEVMNEIEIMAGPGAGHPNVQDIVDYVVEGDKAYIVSSLCRGGDLAQALDMRGCLCEEDARNVMAGILRGLAHLHSRGVAHRDIKLENILLTDSKHDMSKVKIIDLGFAKQLASIETYHTVCGTPMYIAPEMIRPTVRTGEIQSEARYGTQADMWACGIILYYLLSGCPPFESSTSMLELFGDIEKAEYEFSDPIWETVSEEAVAIIEGLLKADPAERLTADEALRHPWMLDL